MSDTRADLERDLAALCFEMLGADDHFRANPDDATAERLAGAWGRYLPLVRERVETYRAPDVSAPTSGPLT